MGHLVFNIDVMLAKRKMSVTELANRVGITLANMSILKNGNVDPEERQSQGDQSVDDRGTLRDP